MPASAQSDDLAQWLRILHTRAKFDIRFEQLYTFPKEKDSLPFTNSDHQDYHSLLVQDPGLHIYFPGSLFFFNWHNFTWWIWWVHKIRPTSWYGTIDTSHLHSSVLTISCGLFGVTISSNLKLETIPSVFFFPIWIVHQQNLSHPPSLCRAQMENGALTGLEKTLVGELDSQPFRERDEKLPIMKHHLKMVAFHAIFL